MVGAPPLAHATGARKGLAALEARDGRADKLCGRGVVGRGGKEVPSNPLSDNPGNISAAKRLPEEPIDRPWERNARGPRKHLEGRRGAEGRGPVGAGSLVEHGGEIETA